MLAHELLHFAKAHGKQAELKERLLEAYFVEGRHVGRDEDLADLAAEVGLDRDEAAAALADHRYLADVKADMAQAIGLRHQRRPVLRRRRHGTASPARRTPTTFAQVLTQVAAEQVA